MSYDLSSVRPTLRVYKSGKEIFSSRTVGGDVYPVLSVGDGAVVKANFGASPFQFMPPGFEAIMVSIDLL